MHLGDFVCVCVCALQMCGPLCYRMRNFLLKCMSCLTFNYFFLPVVHCRCSKCYSVPARKRVRKRTPALTLLSLPEEVLLCVLQCLSAEDLLSVRAVSKHCTHCNTPTQHLACMCRVIPDVSCFRHLVTAWFDGSDASFDCLDLCYRFTPTCGTLLTTTPVYGPGSVSGTRGHPPTPYGYLKGTVTSVTQKTITHKCIVFLLYGFLLETSIFFQSCWEREFWSCCEARDRLFVQWRTWVKLQHSLIQPFIQNRLTICAFPPLLMLVGSVLVHGTTILQEHPGYINWNWGT